MVLGEKVILVMVVVVAVYTDIKYRKIYNISTFAGTGAGLLLSVYAGGLHGLKVNLAGLVFGLALLMPIFYLGGVGGGDVKLLATVGAIGGYPFILWASSYMAVAGVFMAIASLLRQGRLKKSAGRIGRFIRSLLFFVSVPAAGIYLPDNEGNISLPYGAAIGLGALAAIFLRF
ncbi:MAG TPA: hypothetical protein ENH19_02870 [Actinobacteria bacterium]|nr:hypothetical protein [Actinomycetes bacterium]HEX21578.1 hypothetical protein [Actinomycetota bacterium]